MSNFQSTFCVHLCIFACLRWWITLTLSFCMGVMCPRWFNWYLIVRLCNNCLCVSKWFTHNSILLLRLPIDVGKLGYWSTTAVAVTNLNLIMVRDISVCVCLSIDLDVITLTAFRKDLGGRHMCQPSCFFINTWMSIMCVLVCCDRVLAIKFKEAKDS